MGKIINHKEDVNFSVSNFDKMFGIQDDKFLTFLFLIIKYYIFVSKFPNKKPYFVNLLTFIKNIRETECNIANRGKNFPFTSNNGGLIYKSLFHTFCCIQTCISYMSFA